MNREQIQASLVKIVSAQLGIEKTAVALDTPAKALDHLCTLLGVTAP